METNLSRTIEYTSDQAKYDMSVKEMLADKQVLARILKYALDEFAEYSIDEIISCIGEPEIGKVRVEPGLTNTEKVSLMNAEDVVVGEGKIYFDIRFAAYCNNRKIKIIINIEAQKSTSTAELHYHLDNRIIYYLARMISSQKEVEFTKSNYDDIKAVKSIWICMDSEDDHDSINRFSFTQESIYGEEVELSNLNKVQGIIIRLRKNENAETSKNELISMLEELLKREAAEDKKAKLVDEFNMVMSVETERRVNFMCNLSEVMIEKGMEKGIEKGIEEGMEKGLMALIETIKSFTGNDFEKIAESVRKNEIYANVSDEDIKKYI